MDGKLVKVFANNMVDMKNFVDFDPEECGITEKVSFPVLCQLLEQYSGEELKEAVADHVDDLVPKHITVDGHHGLHQLSQRPGPQRGHPR